MIGFTAKPRFSNSIRAIEIDYDWQWQPPRGPDERPSATVTEKDREELARIDKKERIMEIDESGELRYIRYKDHRSFRDEIEAVFAVDPLVDYAVYLHSVGVTSMEFGQKTVDWSIDSTKRNRMINLLRDIELGFIKFPKKKRG